MSMFCSLIWTFSLCEQLGDAEVGRVRTNQGIESDQLTNVKRDETETETEIEDWGGAYAKCLTSYHVLEHPQ